MKSILFILVITLLPHTSSAETDFSNSYQSHSSPSFTEFKTTLTAEEKAIVWGLTSKEWTRYEKLMQGDAKYQFRNSDPITILGIYAESDRDRDRYADMLVEREAERARRFDKFNQLWEQKIQLKFHGEKIIDLSRLGFDFNSGKSNSSQSTHPQLGDRLLLFLNIKEPGSTSAFQTMLDIQKRSVSSGLDIVFTNNTTEKEIQNWARSARVDVSMVSDGFINLDIDDGVSEHFDASKSNKGFLIRGDEAYAVPL